MRKQRNETGGDNMTALQRAKAHTSRKRKYTTPEHIELALAWVRDEITITQAQVAVTGKSTGVGGYVCIALALREYIQQQESK